MNAVNSAGRRQEASLHSRRGIQVSTDLEPVQLPVYLDVVEFRQVVINLLLNAADAMPQGGSAAASAS